MNYAICENERVSEMLETISNWFTEKDKNLTDNEYEQLVKLSNEVRNIQIKFNNIVDSYWERQRQMEGF